MFSNISFSLWVQEVPSLWCRSLCNVSHDVSFGSVLTYLLLTFLFCCHIYFFLLSPRSSFLLRALMQQINHVRFGFEYFSCWSMWNFPPGMSISIWEALASRPFYPVCDFYLVAALVWVLDCPNLWKLPYWGETGIKRGRLVSMKL